MKFILSNWELILSGGLFLAEIIVKITPTEKDNSILNKVTKTLDFIIPNRSKDGKRFYQKTDKK